MSEKRKCECGCGLEVKPGNKFVHGHNTKMKLPKQAFIKGAKPWNYRLTMEEDDRLKEQGRRESATKRNLFVSGELEIWNKDLTSKDNPSLLRPNNKNNFLKNGKAWNRGLNKIDNPELITYGISGPEHWNWKGNKRFSKKFLEAAYGKEFLMNADVVFRESYGQCKLCRKDSGLFERNHVHHILPFDPFEINDKWNLMVLCKRCHPKVERYFSKMFETLFFFLSRSSAAELLNKLGEGSETILYGEIYTDAPSSLITDRDEEIVRTIQ